MSGPPPIENPEERIEWIIDRAELLDAIRSSDWIADEIEKLWNNPEDFEDGGLYEVPEGVKSKDYSLFKLGMLFGTDYEYYFPRDKEEEWIPEEDR